MNKIKRTKNSDIVSSTNHQFVVGSTIAGLKFWLKVNNYRDVYFEHIGLSCAPVTHL